MQPTPAICGSRPDQHKASTRVSHGATTHAPDRKYLARARLGPWLVQPFQTELRARLQSSALAEMSSKRIPKAAQLMPPARLSDDLRSQNSASSSDPCGPRPSPSQQPWPPTVFVNRPASPVARRSRDYQTHHDQVRPRGYRQADAQTCASTHDAGLNAHRSQIVQVRDCRACGLHDRGQGRASHRDRLRTQDGRSPSNLYLARHFRAPVLARHPQSKPKF